MITPSRSLVLQSRHTYVAAVLIVSILALVTGLPGAILRAHADQITQFSDTLSTSIPSAPANHTIRFTTPSGVPADGSTITVTIPAGFDVSSIIEDDVDITDDGTDLTTDTVCGAVQAAVTISGQIITIEICNGGGGAIAATSVVEIEIGNHATASGTGVQRITNHANVGSYQVSVGGTMADSGNTRIVIVEGVTVTGAVDTFFSFSIDGVDAGQTVNAEPLQTMGTTTATSVAFGVLAPDTEYVLAQDLSVITNSREGFLVAVYADGNLFSGTGSDIGPFADGAGTAVPTAWSAPTGTYNIPDTYGHWGLTTEDTTLSDGDSFGNALYVGDFISSPREIFHATSSADGTTPGVGTTRVGYKIEITTMQEAANEYTARLVYIATPTF